MTPESGRRLDAAFVDNLRRQAIREELNAWHKLSPSRYAKALADCLFAPLRIGSTIVSAQLKTFSETLKKFADPARFPALAA
jgi:hypothetical protein